ncbi:MAG: hypothetical protein GY913_23215 [Proteobacteria bacterium]|nr:hypothetical protein [Pseudomonadota bacterium]MCP4919822.1 hypothetical protein [Pseudomonadota bacterium]
MLLLLASSCVKYPEFSQYRMPVADTPVPTEVTGPQGAAPATAPLEVPSPGRTPTVLPPPLDVEGTTWTLHYTSPDGPESYDIALSPGGISALDNPHDTTPDNDTWSQTGPVVELTMNDGFVTYRGVFTDIDLLRGTAHNTRDESWGFAMTRQGSVGPREMTSPDALIEDDGLRNDLSGTSWHLEDLDPDEPVDIDLTFTGDGTLATSLSFEDNVWLASDGAVHFWINDSAVEHVAVETWPGQMIGVAMSENGKQWAFLMRKR